MTLNPYQEFVLPSVRAVIQLYNNMTPEQEASLKKDNHLLFFNLLHVKRALEAVDASRADMIKQRDALNEILAETEPAEPATQPMELSRVPLTWHKGYGYRCPRCYVLVTYAKRDEPRFCPRCEVLT